jgi:hypothetical protein
MLIGKSRLLKQKAKPWQERQKFSPTTFPVTSAVEPKVRTTHQKIQSPTLPVPRKASG